MEKITRVAFGIAPFEVMVPELAAHILVANLNDRLYEGEKLDTVTLDIFNPGVVEFIMGNCFYKKDQYLDKIETQIKIKDHTTDKDSLVIVMILAVAKLNLDCDGKDTDPIYSIGYDLAISDSLKGGSTPWTNYFKEEIVPGDYQTVVSGIFTTPSGNIQVKKELVSQVGDPIRNINAAYLEAYLCHFLLGVKKEQILDVDDHRGFQFTRKDLDIFSIHLKRILDLQHGRSKN